MRHKARFQCHHFGKTTLAKAVEIKSGSTFASDWPDAIHQWQKFAADEALPPVIVYGGEGDYERQACRVLGWRELPGFVL